MSEHHAERQVSRFASVQRNFEQRPCFPCGERDQKESLGNPRVNALSGLDEQFSHVPQLALAATRQQSENRSAQRQSQTLPCSRAARQLRKNISQRVSDECNVNRGALIIRRLE